MHERRSARLAAWFAVSNLGLMTYMKEENAGSTNFPWPRDPTSAMCDLSGGLIESDEHEEIFCEEADSWHQKFKNITVEEAREQYKWNQNCAWFENILAVSDEELDKMRGY